MKYIDLRSDTVTQLTSQMRKSIVTSAFEESIYGEEKAIVKLQKMAAKLMGKEAACFVPSGTFGNQCSILTAGSPGTEIIMGDKCHMISYENGSVGKISRMLTRTVQCEPSLFIPVQGLKKCLRKVKDSQAPLTTVFTIQNPTSSGRIYPIQQFRQLIKIAKQSGVHVHLDGARIFNAIAQLKIDPSELVKECDSVMFCLSKGLCAPMGSIVVGSSSFIEKFTRNRQLLGGFFTKPGILGEIGLISLEQIRNKVFADNEAARLLGKRMSELPFIQIIQKIETNMVLFKFTDPKIKEAEIKKFLIEKNIKTAIAFSSTGSQKFVCHQYIRQHQINEIVQSLRKFHKKVTEQA